MDSETQEVMDLQRMNLHFRKLFQRRPGDLAMCARDSIFSSLADGILVLDAQGKIVEMNPAAQVILGQTPDEMHGKSIEQIFRKADLMEDWVASGDECAEFITGIGSDQQTYELRVHPLGNHQQDAGRLVLLHDITAQRILTEQIQERSNELKQLAVTDELTGIANRRRLFELGERELTRARRFGRPFSAIKFDIDHFKRINDVYGQAIGDQVLAGLAPIIQENIRDTDLLARYGGEEFVLTLSETSLTAACEVAERIRKTIAAAPISTTVEKIRVTISLGVAEITAETRNLEDLLNAADNAMYKAKQAGRNRIFFADHTLARHFYFDFLPA